MTSSTRNRRRRRRRSMPTHRRRRRLRAESPAATIEVRVRGERDRGRSRRANEELSFGSDVEHAGAKRDCHGKSGENERRGANQRPGPERVPRSERSVRQRRTQHATSNPVAARSPPVPTISVAMSPAATHRDVPGRPLMGKAARDAARHVRRNHRRRDGVVGGG